MAFLSPNQQCQNDKNKLGASWCVCVCVCVCVGVCEVCAVAEKVIWDCLVEEPTLFLRVFLEKLTHRDKQDELIFLLRKLLYFVNSLPAQTAHSLFNYIVSSVFYSS